MTHAGAYPRVGSAPISHGRDKWYNQSTTRNTNRETMQRKSFEIKVETEGQKKLDEMKSSLQESKVEINSDQERLVEIQVIRESSFGNQNGRNADLTVPLNASTASSSLPLDAKRDDKKRKVCTGFNRAVG